MYMAVPARTKSRLNQILVLTWILLFVDVIDHVISEDLGIDVVNAARCRVRCLSLLQGRQPLPVAGRTIGNATSLASCQQDTSCADCSMPCDAPVLQRPCEDVCILASQSTTMSSSSQPAVGAAIVSVGDDGTSCRESCRFLQRVNDIRPGTCPPETQATGFAALCTRSCVNDADCESGAASPGEGGVGMSGALITSSAVALKCCSNGCGWTCQRPTHIYEGMPNVVEVAQITERKQVDGADVVWRSQSSNATGTVLYLVSSRYSVGRHFSEAETSSWQIVMQTMSSRATIERLRPAHWYQFRVAAVNIYGSRGWSSPAAAPFKLSREPAKPEPPFNLTEGDTVIMDGRVAVTVHWSEPKNADLPVSRYKIFWSKRLKSVSPQLQSLQEMRRVISGDQRSFQFTDLDPDTTYYIQIQAVVQYGETRLKSDKASISIMTFALSRSLDQAVPLPTVSIVTSGAFPTPVSPENIKVHRIYFQNGLLRANISWSFEEVENKDERCDKVLLYWSPEVCASEAGIDEPAVPVMSATTHDNHFIVYDLRFACRYLIRLQPVSLHRVTGEMAYISLSTPFCWQATVIGGITPDCPRNAARLPEEPLELNYTLVVGHADISAKLSWKEPHVPTADPPITGYQVVWGPVLPASHHLLMDKEASDSRELPKDMRSMVINLDEDTTYAVYVRAMSRYGLGRIASVRLNTPRLELPTPANPTYVDIGTENTVSSSVAVQLSPTPLYVFIGYSPAKRDPNRSIGQQPLSHQNSVAAAPPRHNGSSSSASCLPALHQLYLRTLSSCCLVVVFKRLIFC